MTEVVVELTGQDLADADSLAALTYEKWKNHRGNYPNKLTTHRTGKLGELGVERWADELGVRVDPVFRDLDRDGEADVRLDFTRIEVKTWSRQHWEGLGRCVTPNQLPHIETKADAIIWTVVDEAPRSTTVTLAGWSLLDDVASTAPSPTGRLQILNHQVGIRDTRPMPELIHLVLRRG